MGAIQTLSKTIIGSHLNTISHSMVDIHTPLPSYQNIYKTFYYTLPNYSTDFYLSIFKVGYQYISIPFKYGLKSAIIILLCNTISDSQL